MKSTTKRPAAPKSAPKARIVAAPTIPAPAQMTDQQLRAKKVAIVAALTSQHRAIDNKIEAARAVVDELNDNKKLVRTAIQNNGVPMTVFDTTYGQMRLKVKLTDLAAIDYATSICREAMGLAAASAELPFTAPVAPAFDWGLVGYQDGIEGRPADAAKAGVPGGEITRYMDGFGRAMEANAAGLKLLKEPPAPPKLPQGESVARPIWDSWSTDHNEWTDNQKDQFQIWFNGLDETIEPDVKHKGVRARIAYLDALAEAAEQEAADAAERAKGQTASDAFGEEASEDELAAQTQRRVIQEQKAHVH